MILPYEEVEILHENSKYLLIPIYGLGQSTFFRLHKNLKINLISIYWGLGLGIATKNGLNKILHFNKNEDEYDITEVINTAVDINGSVSNTREKPYIITVENSVINLFDLNKNKIVNSYTQPFILSGDIYVDYDKKIGLVASDNFFEIKIFNQDFNNCIYSKKTIKRILTTVFLNRNHTDLCIIGMDYPSDKMFYEIMDMRNFSIKYHRTLNYKHYEIIDKMLISVDENSFYFMKRNYLYKQNMREGNYDNPEKIVRIPEKYKAVLYTDYCGYEKNTVTVNKERQTELTGKLELINMFNFIGRMKKIFCSIIL